MTHPAARLSALLAASVLLAVLSNAVAGPERRLAWGRGEASRASAARGGAPNPLSPAIHPSPPARPWVEISGEEAVRLFRLSAPFFDARRTAAYREGHAKGARSFPVWENIDERLQALVREGLDPAAPVVVYCSGGDCEDSHLLGQRLFLAGFDAVRVYTGGFPDWQARGLPISRGDAP